MRVAVVFCVFTGDRDHITGVGGIFNFVVLEDVDSVVRATLHALDEESRVVAVGERGGHHGVVDRDDGAFTVFAHLHVVDGRRGAAPAACASATAAATTRSGCGAGVGLV